MPALSFKRTSTVLLIRHLSAHSGDYVWTGLLGPKKSNKGRPCAGSKVGLLPVTETVPGGFLFQHGLMWLRWRGLVEIFSCALTSHLEIDADSQRFWVNSGVLVIPKTLKMFLLLTSSLTLCLFIWKYIPLLSLWYSFMSGNCNGHNMISNKLYWFINAAPDLASLYCISPLIWPIM